MIKFNKLALLLILACIVIVVLVAVIFYQNFGHSTAVTTTETGAPTGTTTVPPAANNPSNTQPGTTVTSQQNPAKPVTVTKPITATPASAPIYFINPVQNDTLTIGMQNPILWNRAGGISGYIELINANTQVVAGVIIPQVGPNQTSYSWNTRDLLLARNSPFKQDVLPGTYVVRLIYDGNGQKPVTSAAFMITN